VGVRVEVGKTHLNTFVDRIMPSQISERALDEFPKFLQ
jgi:hypothetical protein